MHGEVVEGVEVGGGKETKQFLYSLDTPLIGWGPCRSDEVVVQPLHYQGVRELFEEAFEQGGDHLDVLPLIRHTGCIKVAFVHLTDEHVDNGLISLHPRRGGGGEERGRGGKGWERGRRGVGEGRGGQYCTPSPSHHPHSHLHSLTLTSPSLPSHTPSPPSHTPVQSLTLQSSLFNLCNAQVHNLWHKGVCLAQGTCLQWNSKGGGVTGVSRHKFLEL